MEQPGSRDAPVFPAPEEPADQHMGVTRTLKARRGFAVSLRKSQTIKVINTHGKQVVDFWALIWPESAEKPTDSSYMSMSHTRASILSLSPRVGSTFLTNTREPILTLLDDTSPGIHDTLIAACDPSRYKQLGVETWHASCAENFHAALRSAGVEFPMSRFGEWWCPDPLNLFMSIPITPPQNTLDWGVPESKAGDYVVFKAERNCVVVMSACPQDLVRINDAGPRDVEFVVQEAAA